MENLNTRAYFERRVSSMKAEQSSFISHYKDLSEFMQPRRGRFLINDRNKGERRSQKIVNSTAGKQLKIATSGLQAGVMSPARPWFALGTPDKDMMEFAPVKLWLEIVEERLRAIFNESNLYRMTPVMLAEMLLFATGCMTHDDDHMGVARFYAHTVGSYMIEQNERYEVDVLCRQLEMTVGQLAAKFGLDKVSIAVKDRFGRGDYSTWYPVTHLIEPNPGFRKGNPFTKPYRSVYWEPQGPIDGKNQLLEEKGYWEFPGYCPRWDVTGEDIYGTDSPGMTVLPDVIALQLMERRKAQAIDKMTNPPLRGPSSMRNVPVNSLPGGTNFYDTDGTGNKLEPIYSLQPDLQGIAVDIERAERRIKEGFFVDLFQAITDMEGIQPRNQLDIQHRNEERLLQLGPVLERMHGEFLTKLIDRTFNQMVRARMLPPAPPELQGQPLKVTYISTLAMAQRAVATSGIDRLTAYIGGLVGMGYTEVGDKFDADQAVDEYANAIGVPARLIVSDDAVSEKRTERRKSQAIDRASALAGQAANTAKVAADAKTGEDNLLTRTMARVAGSQ